MISNYEEINLRYQYAIAARSESYKAKKNDEEFYFSDIEGTRTQFTKRQLDEITARYDIPISSKISFALIEQILAFLTGTKPYPKFIAETLEQQDYAILFEKMHNAIWYEGKVNDEVVKAIRDMLVTGVGWTRVRKSNFYNESTFNCVVEHVPWTDVIVDPSSRKADFSDAQWMFVASVMPISKAENMFDVKIENKDGMAVKIDFPYEVPNAEYITPQLSSAGTSEKFCVVREFYEKEYVNLYMDENGNLATKRPEPTMAPNPQLEQLMQQRAEIEQQYQQASQQMLQASQQVEQNTQELATGTNQALAIQQEDEATSQLDPIKQQVAQLEAQLNEITAIIEKTEPEISAYKIIPLESTEPIISYEITKKRRKRVIRTFLVNDRILEKDVLALDEIPLVPYVFAHLRSEGRTFGMMHMIKDFVKAMNKFWAMMIYNTQLNGSPRVMAAEGTIVDRANFEASLSKPGAILEYTPNEALQGRDVPQFIQPSPLSPAHVSLIQMLTQICEYVTGIHGLVQGNAEQAPNSLGGINSMLTFGTQRVKAYGRSIEASLQTQAYLVAQTLHAHAPRYEVIKYFDENDDQKEIELLDMPTDIKFRVRVNLTSNLPTTRNMAAMVLANIAGQTGSPEIQNLMIEFALENMDLAEGKAMREKLDVVRQMQSTIESLQQDNDFKSAQLKALENNMSQKELHAKQREAEMQIEYETQKQIDALAQQTEQYNQPMELGI